MTIQTGQLSLPGFTYLGLRKKMVTKKKEPNPFPLQVPEWKRLKLFRVRQERLVEERNKLIIDLTERWNSHDIALFMDIPEETVKEVANVPSMR
jgi:hypothetical protein